MCGAGPRRLLISSRLSIFEPEGIASDLPFLYGDGGEAIEPANVSIQEERKNTDYADIHLQM